MFVQLSILGSSSKGRASPCIPLSNLPNIFKFTKTIFSLYTATKTFCISLCIVDLFTCIFQTFVDYVTTAKFNNVMDEEKIVDETYSRLLQVV